MNALTVAWRRRRSAAGQPCYFAPELFQEGGAYSSLPGNAKANYRVTRRL